MLRPVVLEIRAKLAGTTRHILPAVPLAFQNSTPAGIV
jgi:hypothetical protein